MTPVTSHAWLVSTTLSPLLNTAAGMCRLSPTVSQFPTRPKPSPSTRQISPTLFPTASALLLSPPTPASLYLASRSSISLSGRSTTAKKKLNQVPCSQTSISRSSPRRSKALRLYPLHHCMSIVCVSACYHRGVEA
jgi:hypothetical protein